MTGKKALEFEVRAISPMEWLPDRCMPPAESLDPVGVGPQGGCESLRCSYTEGRRDKLEDLYRDVLARFGCCGFVAWVGTSIVGYNNFFPREIASVVRFYGWGREEDVRLDTLVHHCVSVPRSSQFRRKGIGTALIEHSLDWAKRHGWERFEVHRVLPDTRRGLLNDQKTCRAFWRQFGFEVFRSEAASDESKGAYGVQVTFSMALDLAGWRGRASD